MEVKDNLEEPGAGYYLDCLPEPVLLRICSYLPVRERCALSAVSVAFRYVTSIRELTHRVDLSRQYTCRGDVARQYFTADRCANIVSLNLNHCYWLPGGVVADVIRTCASLRELHMLRVNIPPQQHGHIYDTFARLHTLSWSINFQDFAAAHNLLNMEQEHEQFPASRGNRELFPEMRHLSIDISDKHERDAWILCTILSRCKTNLRSLSLLTFTNHIRRFAELEATLASAVMEMKSLEYLYIDKKLMFSDSGLLQQLHQSALSLKSLLVTLNVQSYIAQDEDGVDGDGFDEVRGGSSKSSVIQNLSHLSLRLSVRHGATQLYRCGLLSPAAAPHYAWTYLSVEERINRNLSHFFSLCANRLARLRTLRYMTLSVHAHDFTFLHALPHLTAVNLTGYNFAPHPYNAAAAENNSGNLGIHDVCSVLTSMANLRELSLPVCALCHDQSTDDQLAECSSYQEIYSAGKYVGRAAMRCTPESSNKQGAKLAQLTASCPLVERFELINVTFWSAFDSRVYESYNIKSCEVCPQADAVTCDDLRYLHQWRHLHYLSLAGLPSVHRVDFLSDVATHCPNLTSLHLAHMGKADYEKCTIMRSLTHALPLLTNLRDLRVEQSNLSPDTDFFCALQQCPLLERVVIITSRVVRISDPYQLVHVVAHLSHLVFFLLFTGMSYDLCRSLQADIMARCGRGGHRPALLVFLLNSFIIERQSLLMSRCYQIPSCHQRDIMYFSSRTCATPTPHSLPARNP